jgi:ABC-type multidrug transport system permease subunit
VALCKLRFALHRKTLGTLGLYGVLLPLGLFAWAESAGKSALTEPLERFAGLVVAGVVFVVPRFTTYAVASERHDGRTMLLRTTQVNPALNLLSHLAGGMLLAGVPLVSAVVGLAIASPVFPALPALVWFLAGAFTFATLGCSLGTLGRGTGLAQALSNLVTAHSIALCPLLYSADRVPSSIRTAVDLLPATAAMRAIAAGAQGGTPPATAIAVLAVVCVLSLAIALRGFARESTAAS